MAKRIIEKTGIELFDKLIAAAYKDKDLILKYLEEAHLIIGRLMDDVRPDLDAADAFQRKIKKHLSKRKKEEELYARHHN